MATTTTNHLRPLFLLLLALFPMTSCFSRPALMTHSDFDNMQMGTTVSEFKSEVGSPYAIHKKKDGIEEYEYIERIDTGNNIVAENHYFLLVKDGKVVGKYMKRETPPPYDLIYQEQPNYPSYPSGY